MQLTDLIRLEPANGYTLDIEPDPRQIGYFLRFTAPTASACQQVLLGSLLQVERFASLYQRDPYWLSLAAGTQISQVLIETQFLLIERTDGMVVLIVPLIDHHFRASLHGSGDNRLWLIAESGDDAVTTTTMQGVFIAAGDDPYRLLEEAAFSVRQTLNMGRLRREKATLSVVDDFGWCTWDAFYHDVSLEKVRAGLQSLQNIGLSPRLLILDDGWQMVENRQLAGFDANAKFPGGLVATVQMAKQEFNVQQFWVWHAIMGYWGGVHPEPMAAYQPTPLSRTFSAGIQHHRPMEQAWEDKTVNVIAQQHIYRFYQDYHRYLRLQGVDGVKIDNQNSLTGLAQGFGGRVALIQHYHEALEGSVQVHFNGNVINCMSDSSDVLYSTLNSNLTRSSDDYYPNRPATTHATHLTANAWYGLWFAEFVHPDWDSFQSTHPLAGFHAAARAVSGSIIYISDKPEQHDAELLRKLVLPDGHILRTLAPGRPTRDCLFHDPLTENYLLKIFSHNPVNSVIGIFNLHSESTLKGQLAPVDIPALAGDQFVLYQHYTQQAHRLAATETLPLSLTALGYDVVTVAQLDQGIAPLGLLDMFNSGGAVLQARWITSSIYQIEARGGGRWGIYCDHPLCEVRVNNQPMPFSLLTENLLILNLPQAAIYQIQLEL